MTDHSASYRRARCRRAALYHDKNGYRYLLSLSGNLIRSPDSGFDLQNPIRYTMTFPMRSFFGNEARRRRVIMSNAMLSGSMRSVVFLTGISAPPTKSG